MQSVLSDRATEVCNVPRSQELVNTQGNFLLIGATEVIPPRKHCHKTIHTQEMLEDDRPSAALLAGTAALLALNLALAVVVLLDVTEYITAVWGR